MLNEPKYALIQGASRGIGLGLVRQLLDTPAVERVFATSRAPQESAGLQVLREQHGDRLELLAIDLTDVPSMERAAERVTDAVGALHMLFNVAGVLHDGETGLKPEKSLRDLEPERIARSFAVNATGPALMARYFHHLFRHGEPAVWANMSARVGSIGDNFLGGWYGYRASKAALNQITRTFSVEMGRKARACVVVALHPGTVDTALSEPFQSGVPDHKLFSVERAARQLLDVIGGLSREDSGAFFDWAGEPIPW